jgi:hypothetical protein
MSQAATMPANGMNEFMEHTKNVDDNQTEQLRLEGQHEVMLYAMGKALYAPVDLSKPGLRILDSGGANGTCISRHNRLEN